jgi:hypothetical protein
MRCLLFFLLFAQLTFAQKGTSRRSNGDLLSGTWKCVKCADTTVQSILFEDTTCSFTRLTPTGLKTFSCPYKLKRERVYIKDENGNRKKYKIVLLDYNSLELRSWKKGTEQYRKTR